MARSGQRVQEVQAGVAADVVVSRADQAVAADRQSRQVEIWGEVAWAAY